METKQDEPMAIYEDPNLKSRGRQPWNKGKLIGQKPPLKPKQVWAIRTHLQLSGQTRELAMFNLAIDSKLRACDLMRLRTEDLAPYGSTRNRATVRQQKTGRPVQFEMAEQTRQAVDSWIRDSSKGPQDYLFSSRKKRGEPMSTRQYGRLLASWLSAIGLDPSMFGTHSLRRTKASLIYRRTGNIRAVQLLLGHTKLESTVRYLGVEVDDALAIAEQVDV
jgi:integrase